MEYRYTPEGVCSSEMVFEIENNIIESVKIIGGCARKFDWTKPYGRRKYDR